MNSIIKLDNGYYKCNMCGLESKYKSNLKNIKIEPNIRNG